MENNSITKLDNQPHSAPLTVAKSTAIQHWKQQPEQSYVAIRPSTPRAMIEADTPNIWEIRSHTDHATAIGIIVIALIHTARLVNVENNLNETQIGEIANDVLEEYGYLKVEELKYILKTAVKSQKIFGRLDYNVVMNWFKDYDTERTEEAMRLSDQEALQIQYQQQPSPGAVSFEQYIDSLWGLALYADADAVEKLADLQELAATMSLSPEQQHEKELNFKKYFYQQYLKGNK